MFQISPHYNTKPPNYQNLSNEQLSKKQKQNQGFLNSVFSTKWIKTLIAASSIFIGSASSAQAVNFSFTYAPGTKLEQMLGYEMAGEYLSRHFADPVTLNIYIESTNLLPENVLGGAMPGVVKEDFATVYQQLQADATSSADQIALQTILNNGTQSYGTVTTTHQGGVKNRSSNSGINELNLTRANAKALGLITPENEQEYHALDAYILVSDLGNITDPTLSWNYFSETNSSNYIPSHTVDFFSVAVHELIHTMGFTSGIDFIPFHDEVKGKSSLKNKDIEKYFYLQDIFRLSDDSINQHNGKAEFSAGEETKLSFDGGQTKLADMSTGTDESIGESDGNQASHWKKNGIHEGIMEAGISSGTRHTTSDNDRTALDIIGWDLQQNNDDLLTIFNAAKSKVADKAKELYLLNGVSSVFPSLSATSWMDANATLAELLLAPNFMDGWSSEYEQYRASNPTAPDVLHDWYQLYKPEINANWKDDRGEVLDQMFKSSDVYKKIDHWGWGGYVQGWDAMVALTARGELEKTGLWSGPGTTLTDEDLQVALMEDFFEKTYSIDNFFQTTSWFQSPLWNKLDESADGNNHHKDDLSISQYQTESIPEPSSVLGLIGMAIFGIRSLGKKRRS